MTPPRRIGADTNTGSGQRDAHARLPTCLHGLGALAA